MQKRLPRPLVFEDLLIFLGTKRGELRKFVKTKILYLTWLEVLMRSGSGKELLEYFGVETSSNQRHLCLDPNWTGKRAIEVGLTEDEFFSLIDEEENEVCEESSIAEVEKFLSDTQGIFCKKKMEEAMSSITSFKIGSEEKRERFIVGIMEVCGWREASILGSKLAADNIKNFNKTGTVPLEWIEMILSHDGGEELLERYYKEEKENMSVEVRGTEHTDTHASLREEMFEASGRGHVLRKEYAPVVIENIKKMTDLKTNCSIGNVIGKSPATISNASKGRGRIYLRQIKAIADESGVSVNDLLTSDAGAEESSAGHVYSSDDCGGCPADNSERKNISASHNTKAKKEVHQNGSKEYQKFFEEINRVVQAGLLSIGGVSKNRKLLFLGYLLHNLSAYDLQFNNNNNNIRFRKDDLVYDMKLDHLNF